MQMKNKKTTPGVIEDIQLVLLKLLNSDTVPYDTRWIRMKSL